MKFLRSFLIAAICLAALLVGSPAQADERIGEDAPTCDYAAGIVEGCKRQIVLVTEFAGSPNTYTGTYKDALGQVFEVECLHVSDLETRCILGDLVLNDGDIPLPAPLNLGPIDSDPCPDGSSLVDHPTLEGQFACAVDQPVAAPIIGFTG